MNDAAAIETATEPTVETTVDHKAARRQRRWEERGRPTWLQSFEPMPASKDEGAPIVLKPGETKKLLKSRSGAIYRPDTNGTLRRMGKNRSNPLSARQRRKLEKLRRRAMKVSRMEAVNAE